MKKIYVLGNPLVTEDSIPLQFLPDLKKSFPEIEFLLVDPNENFPPEGEKNLLILDTVIGIKKPTLLDLNRFMTNKKTPISPHDYDVLLHLLLLKKMKRIESVKIIGIPSTPLYSKKMSSAGHARIKGADKFFNLVHDLVLRCING